MDKTEGVKRGGERDSDSVCVSVRAHGGRTKCIQTLLPSRLTLFYALEPSGTRRVRLFPTRRLARHYDRLQK